MERLPKALFDKPTGTCDYCDRPGIHDLKGDCYCFDCHEKGEAEHEAANPPEEE